MAASEVHLLPAYDMKNVHWSSLMAAGGCNTYGTLEDLADDPDVDAAYVNAIHVTHKDLSIAMLEGGKHVLSEKPIAVCN